MGTDSTDRDNRTRRRAGGSAQTAHGARTARGRLGTHARPGAHHPVPERVPAPLPLPRSRQLGSSFGPYVTSPLPTPTSSSSDGLTDGTMHGGRESLSAGAAGQWARSGGFLPFAA